MPCVKKAISMDESLFKEAEKLAREMKVSRSQLLCTALREYIDRLRDEALLARLNKVYAEPPDEEEKAFVETSKASLAELTREDEW